MEMGTNGNILGKEFCYARNADVAVRNYRILHPEYDTMRAVAIGYADNKKHPGPFEMMPDDEQEYLHRIRDNSDEKYAMRKGDGIPMGGTFVPVGESELE